MGIWDKFYEHAKSFFADDGEGGTQPRSRCHYDLWRCRGTMSSGSTSLLNVRLPGWTSGIFGRRPIGPLRAEWRRRIERCVNKGASSAVSRCARWSSLCARMMHVCSLPRSGNGSATRASIKLWRSRDCRPSDGTWRRCQHFSGTRRRISGTLRIWRILSRRLMPNLALSTPRNCRDNTVERREKLMMRTPPNFVVSFARRTSTLTGRGGGRKQQEEHSAREQTTKLEHTATKRTRPAKIEEAGQTFAEQWLENGGGAQQQAEMSSLFRPPKNLKLTVKNGIRNLQPYWGILCGYTKRRWVGKTMGEVYATEFSTLLHPLYAKAACRKGRIFINNRAILSPDHRLRDNEFLMHINHRHENEIPDLPIQIPAETDDLLVLNKPAGLPAHPCGNYSVHSVLGLLQREHGREDKRLTCLYRLDRTTTGVLMFAKNEQFDSGDLRCPDWSA